MKLKPTLAFIFLILLTHVSLAQQTIKEYKIADLEKRINESDSVLIVNFWATWCAPCVEELPYFHELSVKYKDQKVKLLLVSLDFKESFPSRISSFAAKKDFFAEIVWLNETNADEFCPRIDSSWSGSIPSTLIINKAKGFKRFIEGKIKKEQLEVLLRQSF